MKYEEAVKLWAAQRLRRDRIKFSEVEKVHVRATYEEGCPTCGGNLYHYANVYYLNTKGEKKVSRQTVDLGEFLKELFEVSA